MNNKIARDSELMKSDNHINAKYEKNDVEVEQDNANEETEEASISEDLSTQSSI